jgi:hypothetical protein
MSRKCSTCLSTAFARTRYIKSLPFGFMSASARSNFPFHRTLNTAGHDSATLAPAA